MRLIVLGTSAGGGCPQWNCACPNCTNARLDQTLARTTDSLAFSDTGDHWTIVNPGTDLRLQLSRQPTMAPRADAGTIRQTRITSVILTDAEIDHAMGVLNLREGSALNIFATKSVLDLLSGAFPLRTILKKYASILWNEIVPGVPFVPNAEFGEGTKVTAFGLSARQPKYANVPYSKIEDAVIGLRLDNDASGTTVAYAPQLGKWDETVDTLTNGAKIILADGTFYTSTELQNYGLPAGTAEEMGHLPLSESDAAHAAEKSTDKKGLLQKLSACTAEIKLLTHINNTNPILRDNSPERDAVRKAGIELAYDGMFFEVAQSCHGSTNE
ncbi:MAG: pyrroloquinoline quinone biosynthesis protein PqqB [Leptolyngbya sp.]|nr:pyrroloquinoline quinone biosynthesis protein PqqB [Candidatus Melainabacteria bacterium]